QRRERLEIDAQRRARLGRGQPDVAGLLQALGRPGTLKVHGTLVPYQSPERRKRARPERVSPGRSRRVSLQFLAGLKEDAAMIDLYSWTTPNGHKITMFLEETGLPYEIRPVNIGKGAQFDPAFLAIAPNNRIPAIVDRAPAGGSAPLALFE